MNHIWNIALNDLRVYFSDRSNLFSLLGLPIILTVLLGVAFNTPAPGPAVLLVDLLDFDATPGSAQLIAELRTANPAFLFCPQDNDAGNRCGLPTDTPLTTDFLSRERFEAGDIDGVIVIPTGFSHAVDIGSSITISYLSRASIQQNDPIRSAINAVLPSYNVPITAQQVAFDILRTMPQYETFYPREAQQTFLADVRQRATELQQAYTTPVAFTLTSSDAATSGAVPQGFGQSIPGMGSMFVMFTVFTGVVIFIRERKQWTLQRLVVLPLHRSTILAGKVLFLLILGMMQYMVVFAVAVFTGTWLGNDPIALALTMLAFVFCITALTLFLSTVMKTEAQANGITLLALTLAPLGGAWWPLEIVPDFMRVIGGISPVSWAMNSYRSLIFYDGTLVTIAPNLLVLIAAGIVLFLLGVRRFSYE